MSDQQRDPKTISDAEWRDKLTAEEYRVTRQQGTEYPGSGELLHNQETGQYHCTCCGAVIFDSGDKFDSGCGWPSFSAQSEHGNVEYRFDDSHGMRRTEIICKNCNAHLGHVFDDGPLPTGKRYCVNSVSMKFQKTE